MPAPSGSDREQNKLPSSSSSHSSSTDLDDPLADELLLQGDHLQVKIASIDNVCIGRVTIMGLASFLPWTVVVATGSFWKSNVLQGKLKDIGPTLLTVIPLVFLTLGSAINTSITTKTCRKCRVKWTALAMLVCLAVFTIFTSSAVDIGDWQLGYGIISLILLCGFMACMGFISSLGTFLGHFPSLYLSCFVHGQALCGVVISTVSVIAMAVFSSTGKDGTSVVDESSVAQCIFITSIILGVLAMSMHHQLMKTDNTKVYWQINQCNQHGSTPYVSVFLDTWRVIKTIKFEIASIMLVFVETTAIYPVVMSKVTSSSSLLGNYYIPVFGFLFFNLFDWIGRLASTSRVGYDGSRRDIIVVGAMVRLMIMGLVTYCHRADYAAAKYSTWFQSDWVFITLMIAFGLTQGCMVGGIFVRLQKVSAEWVREIAVAVLMTAMHAGMLIGVGLSFALDASIHRRVSVWKG